jgi:hypothetical protein
VCDACAEIGREACIEALPAVCSCTTVASNAQDENEPGKHAGAKFQERPLTTLVSRSYSDRNILSRILCPLCGRSRMQSCPSRIHLCSRRLCTCRPSCTPSRPFRRSRRLRPFPSSRKPSPCRLCDACMPGSRLSNRWPSFRSMMAFLCPLARDFEKASSALLFEPMT